MEAKYNTPHGVMECYKHYLIFYLASNGISGDAAVEIIAFAKKHYLNRKYVFISSRSFASPISKDAYKTINPKQMVGIAIVSQVNEVKDEAYREQSYYTGAFSYFKKVDEAVSWAHTVLKSD